jgi:hypothetical protein
VESKWKNYHIITFLDSLSPKTLSLEGTMDLSRDRNEMNEWMMLMLVTFESADSSNKEWIILNAIMMYLHFITIISHRAIADSHYGTYYVFYIPANSAANC